MKTCPHCGTVNISTVYSDCYKCGGKLPAYGTIRPPAGMQPNGRTVIRSTDERKR